MVNGPLFKKIFFYTIPIIASGILQLMFNDADLIVIGQTCGHDYVAAVGATGSLTSLIVNLFIGLASGSSVVVAQAIGAGKPEEIKKAVHTVIPFGLAGGVFLTVIGIFVCTPLLRLMKTPESLLPLSSLYMRIYFLGMVPNLFYNFGAAVLRADGNTRSPLNYLTLAGILNVALNLIFVTVFYMDVAGVALATIISQTLSASLVLKELITRKSAVQLNLKEMKFHKQYLLKILKIGLPAGIQSSIFAISNVLIQSSVNSLGDLVIAGNSASSSLEGFTLTSMGSYQHTASIFAGQNTGAKKYHRVKKTYVFCLFQSAMAGLLVGSVTTLFGRQLLGVYITDSQAAIEFGFQRISIICISYFLCGLMDISTGVLRGMGYSIFPLFTTVIGVCGFRIGWIFTVFRHVEKFHTIRGLVISYPISWAITFIVELSIFLVLYKKITAKKSE